MNVGKSVTKAVDEMDHGDHESAMLHACNAIDGTASKIYPSLGSNARFTKLLRDSYFIFGPMGMPGIDLINTRFPVTVKHPKAVGGKPDIADVIYGIHRCTQGHGAELPAGFELIADTSVRSVPPRTHIRIEKGKIQLSDRTVFGLIAVAVFSPENLGQSTPDGYYLTFGDVKKMIINEWWGRAVDFPAVSALVPMPSVKLDFGDWMI
jgi:hypothetical protein